MDLATRLHNLLAVFPFAVVNMSPDGFSSLQSNLGSHPVIDNAGE